MCILADLSSDLGSDVCLSAISYTPAEPVKAEGLHHSAPAIAKTLSISVSAKLCTRSTSVHVF